MKKDWLFEVEDFSKKNVHLSLERWKHINEDHPEISTDPEMLAQTLQDPTKVIPLESDERIKYFYKYFKYRTSSSKYLLIIVKRSKIST